MIFHNILVIKLRYIGDVLLATPVIAQLRRTFPQAKITMLVNRGTEDMVRGNRDITEVLIAEKGGVASQFAFCLALRRRGFDCVIDLTDGDRSAILSWVTGAPVRVGFNQENRWRGLVYSAIAKPGTKDIHRIERNLSSLRALDIVPQPGVPVLSVSPEDDEAGQRILAERGIALDAGRSPLVMFQPGARYWFKAWPAERFVELADRLAESTGCQILIGGSAQEEELAASIATQARAKVFNLAGCLTLLQYAAVLKRCGLFVGNDAGPMHMAATLGTPVVALFGPSNPAEWGPRSGQVHAIYKGLDCRKCFHPTCDRGEVSCMRQISVSEVYAAALHLLRSGADEPASKQPPIHPQQLENVAQ